MVNVREATIDDLPQAAETLAAAFADYPWTRHTVAHDDHVGRIRRIQALFFEHIGLAHGRVWVADDGRAVAVWTTPDTDAEAAFGEIGPLVTELAGDRAEISERAEAALSPYRPTEPVWFLGTVGVHPAVQGKGLGRAVLEPGIQAAAEAKVPAFLETADPGNVAFYRKLGFEVVAEVDVPDNGPKTWCMSRPPH
ncbi:GNAT family N-acetyltransferase [Actinomadura sp. NPDC047616]|uniref:GNAT family N-acetyltransferase n=1 Tax=Actinomadura sp. NPDC047616 TaxID=3155914 RepID=UPI003404C2CB